ncbi:MAG TPA: hypothetical protein VFC39_19180 [Acidobacteriaceae bacterium]|nr:hypothetical protein [Acidobacteriaceae bacterium]
MANMKGMILASVMTMSLSGCQKVAPEAAASKTSKLKDFLSKTDLLLKIQRLRLDALVLPEDNKDTLNGSIKSHWIPAQISILPVTVEEVNKKDSEVRGANITVQDDYFVISGYGSPTEGKHSNGQASLDLDELVDMQTAITYMQDAAKQWRVKNPSDDTIIRFKSKDGLSLELEQDDDTKKVVFALSIDGTSVTFGDDQLAALSGKLSNSIEELKKR